MCNIIQSFGSSGEAFFAGAALWIQTLESQQETKNKKPENQAYQYPANSFAKGSLFAPLSITEARLRLILAIPRGSSGTDFRTGLSNYGSSEFFSIFRFKRN